MITAAQVWTTPVVPSVKIMKTSCRLAGRGAEAANVASGQAISVVQSGAEGYESKSKPADGLSSKPTSASWMHEPTGISDEAVTVTLSTNPGSPWQSSTSSYASEIASVSVPV